MAKIKKIVTDGDYFCEHCEHVRYCPYPEAADMRALVLAADFLEKTYKKPKEYLQVEVVCRIKELQKRPLYELDLLKIMKEHQGHKVSRFEDSEVYVYSKVKIDEVFFTDMVGFENNKGAYYMPHPAGSLIDYMNNPASRISTYRDVSGRVSNKNYGQWLKEHDDELRWCFEMMAKGQEPEPFK